MDSHTAIKQEMDATGDEYGIDVKMENPPIKNETKIDVELSKTIFVNMNSLKAVKQEIDTIGDEYDCNIDVKIENDVSATKKYDMSTSEYIGYHRRKSTEIKYCSHCDYFTINMEDFNGHLQTHYRKYRKKRIVDMPFKCSHCDNCFAKKGHLLKHLRTECFANKNVLAQLIAKTIAKPFKCNDCDKSFTRQDTLIKHKRVHIKEKRYEGIQCFTEKDNLLKQPSINNEEEPSHINNGDNSYSQGTVIQTKKHTWQKNIMKSKRNLGQEYVSVNTGKVVAARKIGPPCTCIKKCYDRIGEENIEFIFKNYWNLGNWTLQSEYLQKQVSINDLRTQPPCRISSKQRVCACIYFVPVTGEKVRVCKQAFVSIHGINNGRVDKALTKMTDTGMPLPDQRGKHNAHNRIHESRISLASAHITSFPTIYGHYSGKTILSHSTGKTILNENYLQQCIKTKKYMYELYKTWLCENHPGEDPISQHFHIDLLKKDFPNLKFHNKCKKTCSIFDANNVQISNPDQNEETTK